jgi:hypothetical protein
MPRATFDAAIRHRSEAVPPPSEPEPGPFEQGIERGERALADLAAAKDRGEPRISVDRLARMPAGMRLKFVRASAAAGTRSETEFEMLETLTYARLRLEWEAGESGERPAASLPVVIVGGRAYLIDITG